MYIKLKVGTEGGGGQGLPLVVSRGSRNEVQIEEITVDTSGRTWKCCQENISVSVWNIHIGWMYIFIKPILLCDFQKNRK